LLSYFEIIGGTRRTDNVGQTGERGAALNATGHITNVPRIHEEANNTVLRCLQKVCIRCYKLQQSCRWQWVDNKYKMCGIWIRAYAFIGIWKTANQKSWYLANLLRNVKP